MGFQTEIVELGDGNFLRRLYAEELNPEILRLGYVLALVWLVGIVLLTLGGGLIGLAIVASGTVAFDAVRRLMPLHIRGSLLAEEPFSVPHVVQSVDAEPVEEETGGAKESA